MIPLVTLGETIRTVSTFGDPVFIDQNQITYQTVLPQYKAQLRRDRLFTSSVVALDFKLPRASGKKWPEPPRIHDVLQLKEPVISEELCTGTVTYTHLSRRRSVGIVYLTNIKWTHPVINNIFND